MKKNLSLLAAALVTASTALAAPAKAPGKGSKLEVYDATEGSLPAVPDTIENGSKSEAAPAPQAQEPSRSAASESTSPVSAKRAAKRSSASTGVAAAAPLPEPARQAAGKVVAVGSDAFDPVPSEQRAAIARRLELVRRMILDHGRAYDYRAHTLADLELFLKKLDAPANAVADALPAPAPDAPPSDDALDQNADTE